MTVTIDRPDNSHVDEIHDVHSWDHLTTDTTKEQ